MNDYSFVADLYDAYVTETRDLPFWREAARSTRGRILELTAGTGRVTAALLEVSPRVFSFDLSRAMLRRLSLRLAAAAAPPRAVCGDMRRLPFRPQAFELAVIPFQSLMELLDPDERRGALLEARRVLRPGGRLIVTLHDPGRRRRHLDGQQRLLGRFPLGDGAVVVWVRGNMGSNSVALSQQTYRVFDHDGDLKQELCQTVAFALVEPEEILENADAIGFTVRQQYGDYDRSPYVAGRSPYFLAVLEACPDR